MFELTPHSITYKTAAITYAVIPWDSQYLHNTTVEIEEFMYDKEQDFKALLPRFTKAQKLEKGDLIVTRVPPSDNPRIKFLSTLGFYFVETAVRLSVDFTDWDRTDFLRSFDPGYQLIQTTVKDKPAISAIARRAFVADRFHTDAGIAKKHADSRFADWVANSYALGEEIYKFVDPQKQTIGFFIIRRTKDMADLRLAALDSRYTGKGLGKLLYGKMFELVKNAGIKQAKAVINFNNIAVLNVYAFLAHPKFYEPELVFHNML